MRLLHEAGLVKRSAEGRHGIYSRAPLRLHELDDDWTPQYSRFCPSRPQRLRSYLDAMRSSPPAPRQEQTLPAQQLSDRRRQLPRERVDKQYLFDGPNGTLAE